MVKSFLMLGQSNMAGRGFIHEVTTIYNERIQMLRNGRWQMMTEPINYDRPVSGISLASSFADAWCRQNQEDNCYFVTASGLTSNPDGIHIDAISQRKFGLRYFEAFSNKQHVLKPLINENELINLNHARIHTKAEKIYIKTMDFALGKISYDEFESQFIQINNG